MSKYNIECFTDGSCNPKFKVGGWAALVFYENQKYSLQGFANATTHNRMELAAVINSIEYVIKEFPEIKAIKIYTDSQYVVGIPKRAQNLISKNYLTNDGNLIQNADLVKKLVQLIKTGNIELIKVLAHQKATVIPNYNREVDKLSRKIVRQQIKRIDIV